MLGACGSTVSPVTAGREERPGRREARHQAEARSTANRNGHTWTRPAMSRSSTSPRCVCPCWAALRAPPPACSAPTPVAGAVPARLRHPRGRPKAARLATALSSRGPATMAKRSALMRLLLAGGRVAALPGLRSGGAGRCGAAVGRRPRGDGPGETPDATAPSPLATVARRSEASASSTMEAITAMDATASAQVAGGNSRRESPSGSSTHKVLVPSSRSFDS